MPAGLETFLAGLVTGVLLLYLGHWLQIRREGGSARLASQRESDARLRTALLPWVAACLELKEASTGTVTEPGLDPATDSAASIYEQGRAAVAMEPGGEQLERLFRKVVRTAHLLRAETHKVFELIADQDHLVGGAVLEFWREETDRTRQEEKQLQSQLQGEIQLFLTSVQGRLGGDPSRKP